MRLSKIALLTGLLALALALPASAQALPKGFFGIGPQTPLSDADVAYMKAGGITSVRWPVNWATVQPTATGGFDWGSVDAAVGTAARRGLPVLPFLYGAPPWIAKKPTTLPIDNGRARRGWTAFVRAAVKRYGPGGEFWAANAATIPRPQPIRTWQVWNEANFFYFAFPVSPGRYARLLKLTHGAIKGADRGAKVILSGLFGDPDEGGRRGMDAADFLAALYRVPGIKRFFDGAALHPYAFKVPNLEKLTEAMRTTIRNNRDAATPLYITEMGWGSENNVRNVAFEQGINGQVRQLRGAYRYLIRNRNRLRIKGTYWFSWKDIEGDCNFCDSVGLFREGDGFKAKPAWRAFVALTGGRARP